MTESDLPPARMRWSGITHPGRFRQNNEDAFLALDFDARELRYLGREGSGSLAEMDYVFAVSDGMGGAKAGEVASRLAVEKITALLPSGFGHRSRAGIGACGPVLEKVFFRTHQALQELGRSYEECRGMGATLSLCWFTPGWMIFAHVGDSRIYHLPAQAPMVRLTEDHSPVGRLVRAGKISEREARVHPQRGLLYQTLGGGVRRLRPQVGEVACRTGDRFLLCSDGVTEALSDRLLDELARAPELSSKRLVDYAVQESGRDNSTAILIELL